MNNLKDIIIAASNQGQVVITAFLVIIGIVLLVLFLLFMKFFRLWLQALRNGPIIW